MWWLVAFLAVVALALALRLIRIRFHLEGRGTPDGRWALAGAVKLGPAVASFVQAAQVPLSVSLSVFGLRRTVWRQGSESEEGVEGLEGSARSVRSTKAESAKRGRFSRARLSDWLLFMLNERRRIQISRLDFELDYGFANVALTGQVAAGLYAISGVLPEPIHLQHRPAWVAEDRASFAGEGALKIYLLALLWDTAKFMLRPRKPNSESP